MCRVKQTSDLTVVLTQLYQETWRSYRCLRDE